jgi:NAD+ synthase
LAELRNRATAGGVRGPAGQVIPEHVITRAPSAELRENQTDQDSLPPYDVLDQILERLIEHEEPTGSIIAAGFDRDTVVKVERLLYLAEYKRRQAAPGVKVTLKNFGRDRRYPIVNRFRDSGAALPEPDLTLMKTAARARAGGAADF